jgi:hypothetical protein
MYAGGVIIGFPKKATGSLRLLQQMPRQVAAYKSQRGFRARKGRASVALDAGYFKVGGVERRARFETPPDGNGSRSISTVKKDP